MTVKDGKYYFTLAELQAAGISENTILRGIVRGVSHWQGMKSEWDSRVLLVCFDTMREQYKALVLDWIKTIMDEGATANKEGATASVAPTLGAYWAYCVRRDRLALIGNLVRGLPVLGADKVYFSGVVNH